MYTGWYTIQHKNLLLCGRLLSTVCVLAVHTGQVLHLTCK